MNAFMEPGWYFRKGEIGAVIVMFNYADHLENTDIPLKEPTSIQESRIVGWRLLSKYCPLLNHTGEFCGLIMNHSSRTWDVVVVHRRINNTTPVGGTIPRYTPRVIEEIMHRIMVPEERAAVSPPDRDVGQRRVII